MKTIELNGSLRTEGGKKSSKNYRKNEQVPAVLYGGDINLMFVVNARDLKDIIYTPHVHIVNLNIDGKTYESVVKDVQFHPVSDKVLHMDFLQISDDKKVTVSLPVILKGQAEGAKQGGKVIMITRKLRAYGFPQELPDALEVDVTNLGLGKSIMVGDLNFKGVELKEIKSTVVTTVQLTRAAKGQTAEEAAAAPAGAAAPAAAKE